jgi:hypothetical protein
MSENTSVLFVGAQAEEPHDSSNSANFFSAARGLGVKVCRSITENPSLVVCLDWNQEAYAVIKKQRGQGRRAALICLEPSVVSPLNYSKRVQKLFDTVILVGRPKPPPIVPWPQTWLHPSAVGERRMVDRAVMIQSAKYSFVKGQLYSLRIEVAKKDARIDVFGRGWRESTLRTTARLVLELRIALRARATLDWSAIRTAFQKPKNYLGPAASKFTAMGDYRVSVVIENQQGYMSEKFFDSLFAGCIPVYVGPDLGRFGIPNSLYVKADSTAKSVSGSVTKALLMDYETWSLEVHNFLQDPANRYKWDAYQVLPNILKLAFKSNGD